MRGGAHGGMVVAMTAIGCVIAGPLWAFGEEKPVTLPNQQSAPSESGGGFRLWGSPADSGEPGSGKPLNLTDDSLFQRVEEAPSGLPAARVPGTGREEKRRPPPEKRGEAGRQPPVAERKSLESATERGAEGGGRGLSRRGEFGPGISGGGKGDHANPPSGERVEEGFLSGGDPLFAPPPPVPNRRGRPAGLEPPGASGEMPARGVLMLPTGPLSDSAPSGDGWNPGSEWYGQDGNPWR